MMPENNLKISRTERTISDLQRNWIFAYGAITLPLLLSVFVPKILIALITLFEAWALVTIAKSGRWGFEDNCAFLMRVASRILLFTSVIMFGIVILCTDWLVPTVIHIELYNSEIPFITCLIVFPVTVIICLSWLYLGLDDRYLKECQRRNGYYAGADIAASLYYRETRYQMLVLAMISLVLGAVEYWYYFFRYINSNFNSPDRFFFSYMPTVIYLLSLPFMYIRYASLRSLYEALDATRPEKHNKTVVRYLVFCGDDLLLHEGHDKLLDTPAEAIINRTQAIGERQAETLFNELSGTENFKLRYCFTDDGYAGGSNIIHYAAFVENKDDVEFGKNEEWANPYMLDRALASNAIAPILASEFYRIHTITMAWKTYDHDGKRLYPIRHYRPTFRFSDMPGWTVDYDDSSWFDVAGNNEDRRFYRIRTFWNNITDALKIKSQH